MCKFLIKSSVSFALDKVKKIKFSTVTFCIKLSNESLIP